MTTNDDAMRKRLVLAHTHGITHDVSMMGAGAYEDVDAPWYYEQVPLGYSYRITDFQAALLLSQLRKLEGFKDRRREIVRRYDEAFQVIPEIIVQEKIPESDTCRHLYIIRLDLGRLSCDRCQFFDAMSAEGIQPQVHYVPVYWFLYYRRLGYERGLCPNAEKAYEGIMSIPLYPKMTVGGGGCDTRGEESGGELQGVRLMRN